MEINGFRAIIACRGRQSALTRTPFIALLVTLAPWASAQLADAALDATEADSRQPAVDVYCSVGHRSSRLVSRLQARGVENVFKLEGSLFHWANEGRLLSRGDLPAKSVHPYDGDWGELLNAPLRAE